MIPLSKQSENSISRISMREKQNSAEYIDIIDIYLCIIPNVASQGAQGPVPGSVS